MKEDKEKIIPPEDMSTVPSTKIFTVKVSYYEYPASGHGEQPSCNHFFRHSKRLRRLGAQGGWHSCSQLCRFACRSLCYRSASTGSIWSHLRYKHSGTFWASNHATFSFVQEYHRSNEIWRGLSKKVDRNDQRISDLEKSDAAVCLLPKVTRSMGARFLPSILGRCAGGSPAFLPDAHYKNLSASF